VKGQKQLEFRPKPMCKCYDVNIYTPA
jgi:hypothetical protein